MSGLHRESMLEYGVIQGVDLLLVRIFLTRPDILQLRECFGALETETKGCRSEDQRSARILCDFRYECLSSLYVDRA